MRPLSLCLPASRTVLGSPDINGTFKSVVENADYKLGIRYLCAPARSKDGLSLPATLFAAGLYMESCRSAQPLCLRTHVQNPPCTPLFYRFLSGLGLTGAIPDKISNLAMLEQLDLSFNYLVGTVPTGFGLLRKLKFLNLYSNRLSGTVPDFLYIIPTLAQLNIGNNRFAGGIAPSFINVPNLTNLCVSLHTLAAILAQ